MGKIYFTAELFENVWKIIQESYDCLDIANDLKAIQNRIHYGSDSEAITLDGYLREKYPIIDIMLNIADSVPAQPRYGNFSSESKSLCKLRLEQDYYGILCHTAIKKGLVQNIESCIDHVEA